MHFFLSLSLCLFLSVQVTKIKAIYHAMNMFNLDVTQRCLVAECWCPVKDLPEVQAALSRGTVSLCVCVCVCVCMFICVCVCVRLL